VSTIAIPLKTKDAIRTEARRLFARHGYEGVSMRDIAQAVGVQQSAIYNHFDSKQTLLVDLMTAHMERVLGALKTALKAPKTPKERLEAFARFHVTYHMDQSEDVFLAYMELRSLEMPGRAQVFAIRAAYEAELRAILAAGAGQGFKMGDPRVVARALLAMLTGVTVWYREGGALSRADVTDSYVRAALQAVGLSYDPEGGAR